MTIKTTRWQPDTCACVLEYSWDDSESASTRAHSASRVVSECPLHAGKPLIEHFDAVSKDNKRKNKVHQAIIDNVESLTVDEVDSEGVITRRLKKALIFKYAEDGVLEITLSELGPVAKAALRNAIETRLGEVGKVRVL